MTRDNIMCLTIIGNKKTIYRIFVLLSDNNELNSNKIINDFSAVKTRRVNFCLIL